jgi:hypothetical protein
MGDLPDDLEPRIAYRIAYVEASRLAEIARFDHGWGRDFAAGIGSQCEAIEHEVTHRMQPGVNPKVVKLAVEDILESPAAVVTSVGCRRLACLAHWGKPAEE